MLGQCRCSRAPANSLAATTSNQNALGSMEDILRLVWRSSTVLRTSISIILLVFLMHPNVGLTETSWVD